MKLRPYQADAIAAITADWNAGLSDLLLVAATGAGKTLMFLRLLMDQLDIGGRALVLAHRQELIEQPLDRIGQIDPDWLMRGELLRPRVGVVMADRDDVDRQLIIATVQTLASERRLARILAHGPIDILVTDECHHCHLPGTQVQMANGLRSIEHIAKGEQVYGWNGDSFDCYAVDNTFSYWYDGPIYEVVTASGKAVQVTPNHKLYTQGVRIYASQVRAVQTLSMPAVHLGNDDGVGRSPAPAVVASRDEALSALLCRDASPGTAGTRRSAQARTGRLSALWASVSEALYRWTHQLGAWREPDAHAGGAPAGHAEAQRERGLPSAAFPANAGQQPDGSAGRESQDDAGDSGTPGSRQSEGVWRPAVRERRRDDAGRTARDGALPGRIVSTRSGTGGRGVATPLQNRRRVAGPEAGTGVGRLSTYAAGSPSNGSTQGQTATGRRLDGRSRVESGRALREDRIVAVNVRHYTGLVHDIEVRDVHNYVANGLLSSNSTAASYLKVYAALKAANPGLKHLGVTATPIRGDGDGLARVYQKDSARITIADLVRAGFLVQPRWLGISTGISIKGIASSSTGDFVQSQLAKAFDTPGGRAIVLAAYQQYAAGRRAIAFTASVAGAHDLAASFTGVGIPAAAVSGETPKDVRRELLARFRRGEIQVMCNCQVLTEGFDAPGTACILMCRPTRSDSAYVQAMGRGLRPALGTAQPGEDCLILDFLPEETRNIVMAGDVLGLPKDVTRAAITETDGLEPGAVQAGFTFDGEHFDSNGTPLEIVARQLDYLQASAFAWDRRDGWMVLGLGAASDGIERILVITPPRNDATQELIGLRRCEREPWQVVRLAASDEPAQLQEQADGWIARYASGTLSGKDRAWRAQPITDGQRKFLLRLAGRREVGQVERLTKGDAARAINFYLAKQALQRAGVWA
jgi:superfamily II DNA or RNA helicase